MNNNRKNMGAQRRTMAFNAYNRNFDRPRFNPWQSGVMPNSGNSANVGNVGNAGGVGPMGPVGPDATYALANNLLNMLQNRPNPMPSLLDINVRRDFGNNYGNNRFPPNKIYGRNMPMGGQMNRRVLSGGRNDRTLNKIRRPMRPNVNNKAKSVPKVNQEIKKELPESKAETATESENVDENEEMKTNEKRDWKQEKPETVQTQIKEESEEKTEEKDDGKSVKTEYDDIASKFLECHICEKRMWDGRSFDNHIKGRVHNIMMEKTKQSYHMTADAMRQELKIYEMKRSKRGFIPGAKKVYCPMCDLLVFYAAAHRRSPGHQKLKKYLHPSCNTCRKEFPTRIELDEHRLTAPHLRLLQEKQKDVQIRSKPEVVMITTLQEELSQVRPMHEIKAKTAAEKKEGDATDTDVVTDAKVEAEESQDEKILLLDYKEGDDLTNMTRENLPRYQTDRSVGNSYITDFTCKQCTLCKKYFDTDETSEVHLRTWKHFQAYIRLIHSKGNFKAGTGQNQDVKQEQSAEDEPDECNWKRRKLENNEDENEDVEMTEITNENSENFNGSKQKNEEEIKETNGIVEKNESSNKSMVDTTVEEINVSVTSNVSEQSTVSKSSPKPRGRGRGRGRGNWARRGHSRV